MTELAIRIEIERFEFSLHVDETLSLAGITGLFGANGAGKTTLLRIIAGLDSPTAQVRFGDTVWQDGRRFIPPHRRRIGFVFQEGRLFPHLSVAGNLDFARRAGTGTARISVADVVPAFEELVKGGVELGVLSNGDPEMLEAALVSAGLNRYLDYVLSADQVRAFKTDATVYALGPRALKRPAREILFVSSNGWDACGATWYGYTTCWINRAGLPLERLGVRPNRIGTDLTTVTDCLLTDYA